MMAVVQDRPKLKPQVCRLREICSLAESCARQLTAWTASNDHSPVQGKRHLTGEVKEKAGGGGEGADLRLNFLRGLKPIHPLFNSPEARAARGEPEE